MGFFAPLLAIGAGAGAGAAVAGTSLGVLGGIGTGLLVFGQFAQGISQYNQYRYQADVAEQQGLAMELSATMQERRLREQGKVLQSRQIASAAASGIIPFYGSPLEVQIESRRNILEDINSMWFNARTGISQARSEASLYSMSAPMALGGSLIEGAGSLFSAYSMGQQNKIPKSGGFTQKYPGGGAGMGSSPAW